MKIKRIDKWAAAKDPKAAKAAREVEVDKAVVESFNLNLDEPTDLTKIFAGMRRIVENQAAIIDAMNRAGLLTAKDAARMIGQHLLAED